MPRWPELTFHERLHAKIDTSGGPDACHQWIGARATKNGVAKYGHLLNGERFVLAHRAIWEEANGPVPPETPFVLHRCDNPPCCNLRHLFLGTGVDNLNDMYGKGRRRRLGRQCARLSRDERETIRKTYQNGGHTLRELASQFGASYGCIRAITRA